jgi:hypothetical protein
MRPRRARAGHGEQATQAMLGVGDMGEVARRGSRVGGRGSSSLMGCGAAVGAEK